MSRLLVQEYRADKLAEDGSYSLGYPKRSTRIGLLAVNEHQNIARRWKLAYRCLLSHVIARREAETDELFRIDGKALVVTYRRSWIKGRMLFY